MAAEAGEKFSNFKRKLDSKRRIGNRHSRWLFSAIDSRWCFIVCLDC